MLTTDPFRRPAHEGGAITARPSDADARADRFDQFARDERQRIGDEADALARLNPDSPHAPRRQADHDRRADQARQIAHAASRLADLFRAGFVPSALYGLRTRAHLRAAVLSEHPTPDVLHTLRTALRFTRGLGMSRTHAFHKVRHALALAGALDGAGETPDPFDAWRRAVSAAFRRRLPPAPGETPLSADSFRTLDWRRAFASGLTPAAAVEIVVAWIIDSEVYGPRRFSWAPEERTERPTCDLGPDLPPSPWPASNTPPSITSPASNGRGRGEAGASRPPATERNGSSWTATTAPPARPSMPPSPTATGRPAARPRASGAPAPPRPSSPASS